MNGYTNANGGTISVIPLSVTENGTYTATLGSAYSPVEVNVSGSGGGDWRLVEYDPIVLDARAYMSIEEVTA